MDVHISETLSVGYMVNYRESSGVVSVADDRVMPIEGIGLDIYR